MALRKRSTALDPSFGLWTCLQNANGRKGRDVVQNSKWHHRESMNHLWDLAFHLLIVPAIPPCVPPPPPITLWTQPEMSLLASHDSDHWLEIAQFSFWAHWFAHPRVLVVNYTWFLPTWTVSPYHRTHLSGFLMPQLGIMWLGLEWCAQEWISDHHQFLVGSRGGKE